MASCEAYKGTLGGVALGTLTESFGERQYFRLLHRIEINNGPKEGTEHPCGALWMLAEIAGPLGQQGKIEMVRRRELEDDRRIRLADNAALDLGEVGVRDAGAPLDVPEGQAPMQASAPKDLAQDGLSCLGTLDVLFYDRHASESIGSGALQSYFAEVLR